jgi:AcrR family transcriptional regulator
MAVMQNYFRTQAIGATKRTRTRSTLIDSAIDVFSEKGIEEASIHEITAIAGLANGTFYNHFKDKDELALASSEAIALEIAKVLDERMSDLDRGVSRVVVASWAFLTIACSAEPWACVLVGQYLRHPGVEGSAFQYMRADIERAVAQGQVEAEVDTFLLEQIASLMMAALRRLLNVGMQADVLSRTCENILRLLGLTPTQARREVERVSGHPLLDSGLELALLVR